MPDYTKDQEEDEEDEEGEEDEGGSDKCPECGTEGCEAHLLGVFDRSGDHGEFGVGLVGGPLCEINAIGEVFELVQMAWVKSVRNSGKPTPPAWIEKTPYLRDYFEDLDDDFNIADYDNDKDAASDLVANSYDHVTAATFALHGMLNQCGWAGVSAQRTQREHDVPLYSTIYESWWDPEPEKVVAGLKDELRHIIRDASEAAPAMRDHTPEISRTNSAETRALAAEIRAFRGEVVAGITTANGVYYVRVVKAELALQIACQNLGGLVKFSVLVVGGKEVGYLDAEHAKEDEN
jgi:hypothetical protein